MFVLILSINVFFGTFVDVFLHQFESKGLALKVKSGGNMTRPPKLEMGSGGRDGGDVSLL